MEDYMPITKLNDFIFCPLSLYFKSCYSKFNDNVYYQDRIIAGKIEHDKKHTKDINNILKLINFFVYSDKYMIIGKIDEYNILTKELIEYKNNINRIYDGYIYQVWAQYFCLTSMGYAVDKMSIVSISSGEEFIINKPSPFEIITFNELVEKVRFFRPENYINKINKNFCKCRKCIYRELCNNNDDLC